MNITWLIIIGVISVALITVSIICLVTIHHHTGFALNQKSRNNNKSPRITESVKDIYCICYMFRKKEKD